MLYLSGERKIIKYLLPSLFFFLCHRICNVLAVKIKVLNNLIYSDPESVLTVSIYYFLTRFCGDLNSTNLLVVNIILFHFIFLLILFFSAVVFPLTFLLKLWLFFCFFQIPNGNFAQWQSFLRKITANSVGRMFALQFKFDTKLTL